MFEVGTHVVCITTPTCPPSIILLTKLVLPVVGKVYTVRSNHIGAFSKVPCILVEEILDQEATFIFRKVKQTQRVLFNCRDFRPLKKLTVKDFMSATAPVKETM